MHAEREPGEPGIRARFGPLPSSRRVHAARRAHRASRGRLQAEAMKVVLLAGGRGSRLSEETQLRPKPMVEIGGHPILWHIMMIDVRLVFVLGPLMS
jgi:hypothetical protein